MRGWGQWVEGGQMVEWQPPPSSHQRPGQMERTPALHVSAGTGEEYYAMNKQMQETITAAEMGSSQLR